MNHSEIQSKMAHYLDGELPLGVRARFDGHLDQCEVCRDGLAEMRATIRALRTLPSPEPPAGFAEDVVRRIHAGEGQPDLWARWSDSVRALLNPRFALPATALLGAIGVILVSNETPLRIPQLETAWRSLQGAPIAAGDNTAGPPLASIRPRPESARRGPAIDGVTRVTRKPERSKPTVTVGQDMTPGPVRENSGATTFLFRVASERLGPMSRGPRPGPILVEDPALRVGASLGSSAVVGPSVELRPVAVTLGLIDRGRGSFSPVFVPEPLSPEAGASRAGFAEEGRRELALDARLELLERDPAEFARRLARTNLAERELWIQELAVRAIEIDRSDAVIASLRGSPAFEAQELAELFVAAVDRSRANLASAAETPTD